MYCPKCYLDVDKWLNKFKNQSRVYLDKLFFDENRLSYDEDARGLYISGQKFFDVCSKNANEKCPRCSHVFEASESVCWGPI